MHDYISSRIKYLECKMEDGSGCVKKPTKVLFCMRQLRMVAARMHHNHSGVFVTDDQLTRALWNALPEFIQN